MPNSNDAIELLFFQGNYRDLLKLFDDLDFLSLGLKSKSTPWFVGALCFSGRQEQAEKFFLREKSRLNESQLAACHFFLGIAYCRHGHYATARRYFAINLLNLRRTHRSHPHLAFYALQGLAFYRYFCARFLKAKIMAEEALIYAKELGFQYGTILAIDLAAHSKMQIGEVASAFLQFQEAHRRALALGHGGLSNSINISILSYRAQFGVSPKTILKELRDAHKNLDAQNSHAQANLLLEVANQRVLRGQLKRATEALDSASTLIYETQHRRYAHLLGLRYAELAYRSGHYANALQSVRTLRPLLSPRHDRTNLLMAIGLELKLLRTLKLDSHINPLEKRLESLTHGTERAISRNIRRRSGQGEDVIGRLFYECMTEKADALPTVVRSGYLGLVYETLGVSPGKQAVVIDIEGGGLLLLDRGEVIHQKAKLSPLSKKLLLALRGKEKTKEELIEFLWEHRYRPLHHDPLIYQAITRLRENLGSHGHWIEAISEGYRLMPAVELVSATAEVHALPKISPKEGHFFQLNTRQIRILRLFKQKEFLGVNDCIKVFKVSDMTIKRDLAFLLGLGLLVRHGRARATRYALRKTNGAYYTETQEDFI